MTNTLALIVSLDDILAIDTNFFNGIEHCPRYDEIYRIFDTVDFPSNDENLKSMRISGKVSFRS
jgi:hypothetical protein